MREYWKSAAVGVLFIVTYAVVIALLFKGTDPSPFVPTR